MSKPRFAIPSKIDIETASGVFEEAHLALERLAVSTEPIAPELATLTIMLETFRPNKKESYPDCLKRLLVELEFYRSLHKEAKPKYAAFKDCFDNETNDAKHGLLLESVGPIMEKLAGGLEK